MAGGRGIQRGSGQGISKRLLLLPVAVALFSLTTINKKSSFLVTAQLVSGDVDVWDNIFSSRTYQTLLDGPSNDLLWTEGPIIVGTTLFFSDVPAAKMYALDLDAAIKEMNGMNDGRSKHLRIIKERSGDAPPEDDHWRAEPGSNGLFLLSKNSIDESDSSSEEVLMCQHGARRLVIMDLDTGETTPLAFEYWAED